MEMVNLDSDEALEAWTNSMVDQIVEYAMEYDKKQKENVSQDPQVFDQDLLSASLDTKNSKK